MEFGTLLIVFVIISLIVTAILKHFKIGETFILFTLIKTSKAGKYLDKITKHKKILNFIGDFGIIIGFGTLALDYLYFNKYSKKKRILFNIISFTVLSTLFYLVMGPQSTNNPFLSNDYSIPLSLFFGAFGASGLVLASLVVSGFEILMKIIIGEKTCPAVAPVIPGVEIPNVPIVVPLHGWISLLIILVLHEGMHGALARKVKIKIKSAGVILLGFLPIGAFVEPNELELIDTKNRDALRIFAGGPAINILAFISILIGALIFFTLIFNPLILPKYEQLSENSTKEIVVGKTDQNFSLCGVAYPNSAFGEVNEGWKILKMNGNEIKSINDFISSKNLENTATFTFQTEDGQIIERTFEKNKLGYVGITPKRIPIEGFNIPAQDIIFGQVLSTIMSFFFWFGFLNFMIGLINFLPTEPFDGGKMMKLIVPKYFKFTGIPEDKIRKVISKGIGLFILLLFIVNALPLFI